MRDLTRNYRFNPFCEPAWKWHVAGEIYAGKLKRGNFHDLAIRAAVDYLAGKGSQDDRISIEAAHKLHQCDGPRRWAVEARLLADAPVDKIAMQAGLEPAVVVWFERLFFNIADCRHATDYIWIKLTGCGSFYGFKDTDVRSFWLWAAMTGEPVLVDTFVEHLPEPRRSRPPRLQDYFRPHSPVPLGIQAIVAASTLPLNSTTASFWGAAGGSAPRDTEPLQRKVIEAARCYLSGKPLPTVRKSKKPAAAKSSATEAAGRRQQLHALMRARALQKQTLLRTCPFSETAQGST